MGDSYWTALVGSVGGVVAADGIGAGTLGRRHGHRQRVGCRAAVVLAGKICPYAHFRRCFVVGMTTGSVWCHIGCLLLLFWLAVASFRPVDPHGRLGGGTIYYRHRVYRYYGQ